MNDFETPTLALPKGRLLDPSLDVIRRMGISSEPLENLGRKLYIADPVHNVQFLLVRPSDVVTYVSEGAADLGIVGRDTLLEESKPVYELYDLGFGRCHLAVAAQQQVAQTYPQEPDSLYRSVGDTLKVATKYPRTARRHFDKYNIKTHIIKLRGSVELAPAVCLSDVIVDLVSTGQTLAANNLIEVEFLESITARLIGNPVSVKVHERVMAMLKNFNETCRSREDEL